MTRSGTVNAFRTVRPWLVLVIVLAGCDLGHHTVGDAGPDVTNEASTACSTVCHGQGGEAAPPRDTRGRTDTTLIGVGAHRVHLGSPSMHHRLECAACHKVPTAIVHPGPLDTPLPAELQFAGIADGSVWNRDDATCSNTYCHGATLTNSLGGTSSTAGGATTVPVWTKVDGSQAQCTSCHGFPPPDPHPQSSDCGTCHPTMNPGVNTMITYPELHVDGHLDVINSAPCDSCHGSNGQAAPPKDTGGNTMTTARGVGAHAEHLLANPTWHAAINCTECHKVPAGINDQGHIDTPLPAEVVFGPLAGTGTWNGMTCTNTYCHGGGASPLTGGTVQSPLWTLVDGSQRQCGSCHGTPPPPPHPINNNCGACHPTMTSGFGLQITYPALHIDGKVDVDNDKPCDTCHGSNGNPAPPVDTAGQTSTDLRSVGAHRVHLDPSTWRKNITCDQCHKVPTATTSVGHMDTPLPAELTFGPLAGNATWNGATCANTYCHGATLGGGTSKNPVWTVLTGAQSQCGSCHGAPPPPPHPVETDCGQCHNTMTPGSGLEIAVPERHIDGNVDVNTDKPCNSCHGSATSNAPPQDTLGNTATNVRGVGAHQSHLATTTNRFKPIACEDCHRVPGAVVSIGHIDTPLPAELTFSLRAGQNAQWNGARCSNTYCHGSTLTSGSGGAGGTATAPIWTTVDGSQKQCTSCHGNPPPLPHPQLADCGICHDDVTAGTPTAFSDPLRHVDGNVDVNTDKPCNSCHGSATSNAPPRDTMGNSATTLRGIGAHQAHLATGSTWHQDITCNECHTVPSTVASVGHLDSPLPAELTWSGIASGSTWNGTTCTSYCHGATLPGGTAVAPVWTTVDGTQKQCTSCHGNPPPLPHPQNSNCGLCHDDVTPGAPTAFTSPARHIDGNVDVLGNVSCSACHGSPTNSAPPTDTTGNTATTVRGVGAHQQHVTPNSTWHKDTTCDQCHLVPATYTDSGHIDTLLPAELVWSGLATGSTWSGTTCTSYCHGANLTGGAATTPIWTKVDGTQTQCSSCHGNPPPAPHPVITDCGQCHDTMTAGNTTTITAPARHIDGKVDVNTAQGCNTCHGSPTSDAPPQDTSGNTATTSRGVGAHQSHLAVTARFKPVACADCHLVPAVLNAPGHIDTALPAELTFSARAGTTTTWNGTQCSNSYCHGSTLGGGTTKTPTWTVVNGTQVTCTSCHGNPPPLPHPQASDCGQCHTDVMAGSPTTFTAPTRHVDGIVDVNSAPACNGCHGSATSNAPPKDTTGNTTTTTRGVGAHQNHLATTTRFKAIACGDCHLVPATVTAVGHLDSPLPAEVTFSARAGMTTAWNGTTCSNNYCHGTTLTGGTTTSPIWTQVDGTQADCTSCHGAPPPPPHPALTDCGQCHNTMTIGGGLVITDGSRHIDGNVDVNAAPACNTCHGSATNNAPPRDSQGFSTTTARGVGAHQAHVTSSTWHKDTTCDQCHVVPTTLGAPGHVDTPLPAELTWSGLAAGSTWNGSTCTSYCHGTTLAAGGTATAPIWTKVDGTQKQCSSCHGNPPPAPHPQNGDCGICHDDVKVGSPTTFISRARHIDGTVDVTTTAACNACHGSATNDAPPKDTTGNTATTTRGVGAHQPHVLTGSTWHKDTTCVQCHKVPAAIGDPGHYDTPLPAELVWSDLATGSTWNGTTCTSYCHGATLTGGAATAPLWTKVDGTQKQCGSCHGAPPPPPHTTLTDCGQCHNTMTPGLGMTITDPSRHIDGNLDVSSTLPCNGCHGSVTSDAPPVDTQGNTATTFRGVGAHQSHLAATNRFKAIACAECHLVPATLNAPGHVDTPLPAELTFGALSGATTTWNGTACSNNYCHGSTLSGGTAKTPVWTTVNGTQRQCGSCHGNPPALPHPQNSDCGICHDDVTVGAPTTFSAPARHVDGNVDTITTAACNTCHGSATNDAPPKDTAGNSATTLRSVGAHQAHLRTTSAWHKVTTCDQCHLVPASMTDPGHYDTPLPAELVWSDLGTGSTWNGTTCTSYCHGSTLAAGGTATTPQWTKVDGTQSQCTSCHGAPPPAPHPQISDCGTCHSTMTPGFGLTITDPTRHIDGNLDVNTAQACNSCHGSAANNAPPQDTAGNTATTFRGVGAHQKHLATTTRFKAVLCADCHIVPSSVTSPGHTDTALPAELTFSARSGTATTWNGTACSNNYCHGSTLGGGTAKTPVWTNTDGTQAQCTSCHGNPPPLPHPQVANCGECHNDVQIGAPTTFSAPTRHVDGIVDVTTNQACNFCHGSITNNAPPKDTAGNTVTTARGVGAHQIHLVPTNQFRPVACTDCHTSPSTLLSTGHVDTPLPAELTFSTLAGATTTWNGTACSNNYCHGSTLTGGTAKTPVWTTVNGSQAQCTSCHGNPPPLPHPQESDCGICHTDVTAGAPTTFSAPTRHVDGNLDVTTAVACNKCHGSVTNNAPPVDIAGNTATTVRGVGAHQAHLKTTSTWHKLTTCTQCHKVPALITDAGHYDTALPAELTWTGIAVGSTWNGTTCSNNYCHGATLAAGGTATAPLWTKVDGTQIQCASCHGNPPALPHPQVANCGQCHNDVTVGAPTTFSAPTRHIDGNLDVTTNQACNFCHGSVTNTAPPKDTSGNTATTVRGVGAHQAHLATTNRFKVVACTDCHVVPATLTATGHVDSALPAELVFSTRSGTATTWNGTTCSNNYCHGATLAAGGTATAPVWTTVNGSQAQCSSCHGNPPPLPHPQISDCGTCHTDVQVGAPTTFTVPSRHVDGTLDVTMTCNSCHGGTNNAPPKDTSGNTATTTRGVGAHQAHVLTSSTWHKVTTCVQCHIVPTTIDAVGHRDTPLPAELTWTGIAVGSTWNGTTCSSYCHGSTLAAGGTATSPQWTKVDGTQKQCTSCHGNPPPAPHPANNACTSCHADGGTGGTFTTPAQHIDGTLQVTTVHPAGYSAREVHGYDFDKMGSSTCATSNCHGTALTGALGPSCNSCHTGWQTNCAFCHGTTANGAPPEGVLAQTLPTDPHVGAHANHVNATAMHAAWDCTYCHTKPSNALTPGHIDGTGTVVQAEVKYSTLNPSGTFNATTAVCSNLYCHGNGVTSAGTATWTNTTNLTCTSCHGAPPPTADHPKHQQQGYACSVCHQSTIASGSTTISAPALHVNGLKEIKFSGGGTWTASTKSCSGLAGGCHGTRTW